MVVVVSEKVSVSPASFLLGVSAVKIPTGTRMEVAGTSMLRAQVALWLARSIPKEQARGTAVRELKYLLRTGPQAYSNQGERSIHLGPRVVFGFRGSLQSTQLDPACSIALLIVIRVSVLLALSNPATSGTYSLVLLLISCALHAALVFALSQRVPLPARHWILR